jgi:transcriptional regulator with XRE-family HTH domain
MALSDTGQDIGREASRQGFGDRLRQVRRWCDATQSALAAASGVSRGTLGRYENGRSTPREDHLARLAEALHIDPGFLLHGTNPPSPDEIATMRLQFRLERVSPPEVRTAVRLIDGILSQMVHTPWAARRT